MSAIVSPPQKYEPFSADRLTQSGPHALSAGHLADTPSVYSQDGFEFVSSRPGFQTQPSDISYSARIPGAWVGSKPSTPGPIIDDIHNLSNAVSDGTLTEQAKQVLPAAVLPYLPGNGNQDTVTRSEPQTDRDAVPVPKPHEPTDLSTSAGHAGASPAQTIIGSKVSPDRDVAEALQQAKNKDEYSVPVDITPIGSNTAVDTPTFGSSPSRPDTSGLRAVGNPIDHGTSSEDTFHPSKTESVQEKVLDNTNQLAILTAGRALTGHSTEPAPQSSSSPSTSKSGSESAASSSGVRHPLSALPAHLSAVGADVDQVSTQAVGGDTSVSSISSDIDDESFESKPLAEPPVGLPNTAEFGVAPPSGTVDSRFNEDGRQRDNSMGQHEKIPSSPSTGKFSSLRKLTKRDKSVDRKGRHSRKGSEAISGDEATTRRAGLIGTTSPKRDPMPVFDEPASSAMPSMTTAQNGLLLEDAHHHRKLTKEPTEKYRGVPPTNHGSTHVHATDIPPVTSPSTAHYSNPTVDEQQQQRTSPTSNVSPTSPVSPTKNHGSPKPKLKDRLNGSIKVGLGKMKGDAELVMEGRNLKEYGHH